VLRNQTSPLALNLYIFNIISQLKHDEYVSDYCAIYSNKALQCEQTDALKSRSIEQTDVLKPGSNASSAHNTMELPDGGTSERNGGFFERNG
jgi:hypothetical protein